MKRSLGKEIPLFIIVLLPFLYLGYSWKDLPDQVPLHWNLNGEIDRWGNKSELIFIPLLLPLLIYVIFLVVPKIDPKGKIKNMGNKYHNIKLILTVFMSFLALFILYAAKHQSISNPNYLVLLIGILFVMLGNYFKTIKPNYFIGIRTPWTLENEAVWKATHKMGGILWFAGGLIIVIGSLILNQKLNFRLLFIVTTVITIIPVVYSYLKFTKLPK